MFSSKLPPDCEFLHKVTTENQIQSEVESQLLEAAQTRRKIQVLVLFWRLNMKFADTLREQKAGAAFGRCSDLLIYYFGKHTDFTGIFWRQK